MLSTSVISDGERDPELPDDIGTISNLLEVFPRLSQGVSVEFHCFASFNYQLGEQLRSRVSLPYPLLLTEPAFSNSFTHVEAMLLSRREDDQPTHTVMVKMGDGGKSISHFVSFKTDMADGPSPWSRLAEIFEVARRLSMSLLHSPMEEK